jgi:putative transposase
VSRDGREWFVSFLVEDGRATPSQHASTTAVGIDRGVAVAVAGSDGTMRDRQFRTPGEHGRYRRLRQRLDRQQRGSVNRRRTIAAMNQIRRRERDRRHDFVSWTSNRLATRNGLVVLEDLRTRNMTRSAKGSREAPGTRVAQKAALNRSILDKGWGQLESALQNVARYTGCHIIKVPAAYTSQRCSACRTVDPDNRESQAVFRCTTCGHEENADVNAAKNVLADGLSVSACGDLGVARSVKQEPVGSREAVPHRSTPALIGIPGRSRGRTSTSPERQRAARPLCVRR